MVYFLKLHICVYVRTKFQVSSIILTSFRQELILPPHPPHRTPKWTLKKPSLIRVNKKHALVENILKYDLFSHKQVCEEESVLKAQINRRTYFQKQSPRSVLQTIFVEVILEVLKHATQQVYYTEALAETFSCQFCKIF